MPAFLIHQAKSPEPRQAEIGLIAGQFGLFIGREDLDADGGFLDAVGRGYYGRKRCFVDVFLTLFLGPTHLNKLIGLAKELGVLFCFVSGGGDDGGRDRTSETCATGRDGTSEAHRRLLWGYIPAGGRVA